MIDPSALQMLLMVLTGWLGRELEALDYPIEENRLSRQIMERYGPEAVGVSIRRLLLAWRVYAKWV